MEEYDEFYQSDFEKLGFDMIPLNLTEPGRWLTYQNYIFDYKGNIIKMIRLLD
ncbi:hypothetical protein [Prolixibacter sp. SD074]|jgi:mRNA deadenylase 3'-5' endonuclease subunit Ccr4|uniref:hypothetical protein n=1 Tax=Prolixibacter sp. SD074 TaxID=2652391 RepID=UPI0012728A0D|nr:hypothetical protein [Prolixibacter sp. SD074]GET28551.1 hypothetical protein SD074_07530 [Prolixibacter sp. SD074]